MLLQFCIATNDDSHAVIGLDDLWHCSSVWNLRKQLVTADSFSKLDSNVRDAFAGQKLFSLIAKSAIVFRVNCEHDLILSKVWKFVVVNRACH